MPCKYLCLAAWPLLPRWLTNTTPTLLRYQPLRQPVFVSNHSLCPRYTLVGIWLTIWAHSSKQTHSNQFPVGTFYNSKVSTIPHSINYNSLHNEVARLWDQETIALWIPLLPHCTWDVVNGGWQSLFKSKLVRLKCGTVISMTELARCSLLRFWSYRVFEKVHNHASHCLSVVTPAACLWQTNSCSSGLLSPLAIPWTG